MSTTAELVSVADVIERIRGWVSHYGHPVSAAVDQFIDDVELDDDATRFFIRKGMIEAGNSDLASFNASNGDDERYATFARFQKKSPHGRQWHAFEIIHQGADGRMKPLGKFRLPDVQHLRGVFASEAKGLLSKAKVLRDAERLMLRFEVETIEQLPPAARDELAAAIEQTWKK